MNERTGEWVSSRARLLFFSIFFPLFNSFECNHVVVAVVVGFFPFSFFVNVCVCWFSFFYYTFVFIIIITFFFVLNFCFGCISCCCCGCGCWLYSIVFYISIDLNCIHRSPSDQHLGHNRHSSGYCCNKCCKIVCILGALIHKHAVA